MPYTNKQYKSINGKTILITGGTGSFGNMVVYKLLKEFKPKKIIIYSRDEKKQFDMGNKFNDKRLSFVVGDVRDKERVDYAMRGVDLVFHAAALKQVPSCEFFPMEAVKTNILGTNNIILSAINNEVEKVVVLSTDKAVYPINAMGMTKALMEKIMISAAREKKGKTIFCGTRYGNVMGTRGSVIPFFIDLIKEQKPLKITDLEMTRFMMLQEEAIDLVFYALASGQNGAIYVRKSPASTIEDLAKAMMSVFSYDKIDVMGTRPGEKKHESLISQEEMCRTEDCGDYFKINMESPEMDYKSYYFKGSKQKNNGYTSENTKRLSIKDTEKLLLRLEIVKEEIK